MADMKEELIQKIEQARRQLNHSIDTRAAYETIYQHSVELDKLLNQYIGMEATMKNSVETAL